MPNRQTHLPVGTTFGVGAALLQLLRTPAAYRAIELIGAALGGACGGIAPDLLEPALSPGHRSVLHSIVVGGAGTMGLVAHVQGRCREMAAECVSRAEVLPIGTEVRRAEEHSAMLWYFLAGFALGFALGFAAGYGSHLLLDAATPASIPLITSGF